MMQNHPSKWLSFVNAKELKRLRVDINNKVLERFQIMVSAVLAILSVLLSAILKDSEDNITIAICISLIVIVILLYFIPWIVKIVRRCALKSVLINGKDALTIFDEEIVYYLMTACEYSKLDCSEYKSLENGVNNFFHLEVEYYVDKALDLLTKFSNNKEKIFGKENNRISFKRLKNVIEILDALIDKHNIKIDTEYYYPFGVIKDFLECNLK